MQNKNSTADLLSFTSEEIVRMQKSFSTRSNAAAPQILIVEDQDFSRKLLEGWLSKNYICHSAPDAATALRLYAEYLPHITFLDIELPGMDGHKIASEIKKHDPKSFVVMVTANSYEKDVITAKKNKVQGFIIKPYSRQKILSVIDLYNSKIK